MNAIQILLGANIPGRWGSPRRSLRRAVNELNERGIKISRESGLYATEPVGGPRQPSYLNCVALAKANIAPARLIWVLKSIERLAGRRVSVGSKPRPLDLDILDYGGRLCGWPGARRRRGLILPHPELARRAFALVPLLEVAPHWYHPGLKMSGAALLHRLRHGRRGVRLLLDSSWVSCDQDLNLRPRAKSGR